jgi:NAD(P)-dependent dehydrogenase (short-subunit alcohol dehydrogenase family)
VIVAARGAEELEATVAAMTGEGLSAEAAVLDVTDRAAVEAILDRVGPVDVLVNSAGMARHGPALDTEEADYDAVMAVNVKAAYFLAQEVARRMAGPGSIIQISSQMGHVGGIDRAVYCATKHAVEGMTKAMAIEWGARGIRVNTICPTFILHAPDRGDLRRSRETRVDRGQDQARPRGQVEDIMGAVVYLASDASALVTGTALLVDGGRTAGDPDGEPARSRPRMSRGAPGSARAP